MARLRHYSATFWPLSLELVAKGRFMPTWSYFYLAILLASSLYLVISVKPISFARVCGEMASVFSYVAIFVISYDQINVIQPLILTTLLLLYTLLWGLFGYKEHYSIYWMPAAEFAKTVELGKDESFDDAVLSIKLIKSASIALIVLLVSPLFYVYSRMI